MSPKISVIMPVYNSEKYLEHAVESILKQTFVDFELILVDDGSKDTSGKTCDKFAEKDERVVVIHKENGGICDTRNAGLAVARGEYIAFSDNDDDMDIELFKDNYDLVKKSNADIVKFGRRALYIRDDKVLKVDIRTFPKKTYVKEDIRKEFFKMRDDGLFTCVWDGFYRKALLDENSIRFDLFFKMGGEDIDFCYKCIKSANIFVTSNKAYYNHNIRTGISTSTKYNENLINVLSYLTTKMVETANALNTDIQAKGTLYSVLMAKTLIVPICLMLLNKSCGKKDQEKIQILDGIRNSEYIFDWQSRINLFDLLKESNKYGLFAYLFIRKNYKLLLLSLRVANAIK